MVERKAREAREAREASAWVKFKLLMWKNFLQQWRHRKQTTVEVFIPVLTLSLVLILRWQVEPEVKDTITYSPFRANTLESYYTKAILFAMNWAELSIAYSPESPVLEDIVRNAFFNLFAENIDELLPEIPIDQIPDLIPGLNVTFPDLGNLTLPDLSNVTLPELNITTDQVIDFIKGLITVTPYKSSEDLRGIYFLEEETFKVLAAVEFSDSLLGALELPNDVSYALRFPERPRSSSFFSQGGSSWRTETLFPAFEVPGPRNQGSPYGGYDPGYVFEMFLALQHCISTELISNKTGVDVRNFTVYAQRYPHAPYVEDFAVEMLQFLLSAFILISFAYTAVNLVRAITLEKELQLKESMKIMGLPTWLHWTAWFFKQFLYLLVTTILIVMVLKISFFTNEDGFSDYAVLTNTPVTVLFFFILLYLICTIFFCFMVSGFFSKASTAALFTGLLWIISNVPAIFLSLEEDISTFLQFLACLSLNSAMSLGFQIILSKESVGGIKWGEFFDSPSELSSRFTFGNVIVMLAVDCILYLMIALYLEQVLPGPYGAPKKWYFLFQKQFWCPKSSKIDDEPVFVAEDCATDIIMEKDPDLPIGVQMQNLTKVFANNVAVNNLTLNIYDNQITVLLGHNGAGKSTTISMLTGNLEVTSGAINLAGYDMISNPSAARAHLGLCPQHNVIFDELTVAEHLKFFATLKGFSGDELKEEIDALIEKLELTEKRNYQAGGLSGGQKRRLCVGIALSGAAKVVLLDEPTSGMDPSSRRALWELLQKEKKGRSMILTTHFMDEADILGDRVAIMASGKLKCVGSPFYLKSHYGVGFTLVVVKEENFQYALCVDLIKKYIPEIEIKEDRGSEITFTISNNHTHLFEDMLQDLENNKDHIKYKNYGLTATTLEDVFMSVGSDTPLHTDSDDGATTMTEASSVELLKYEFESSWEHLEQTGDSLNWFQQTWRHIWSIWMKLWLVWTRSWAIALLQIMVPVIALVATLAIIEYTKSVTQGIMRRELALVDGYFQTETLLSFNGTLTDSIGATACEAYTTNYQFDDTATTDITLVEQPMEDYYLNRTYDAIERSSLRHRILIGATFDDDSATAWFSNFGYHDVATSLANVHEAILKALAPDAKMRVANYPLEANYNSSQTSVAVMVNLLSTQLSQGIGNSMAIVSAFFIMFYIRERASKAKLLQEACGVQPIIFWGSSALFDWIWFMIICLTIPAICAAFAVPGLSSFAQLGRIYLIYMVYGASMLPLNYILSHAFDGAALGFVAMFFINILLGTIGSQIVEALALPNLRTAEVSKILDYILQFFPLYSLVSASSEIHKIGLIEYTCLDRCEYLLAVLPTVNECNMDVMCSLFPDSCCVRENPFFDWEKPGIARYLVAMAVSFVVLYIVLLIIEHRLLDRLFTRQRKPPQILPSELDEDVVQEAEHVAHMDPTNHSASLVVKDLSKYYGKNLAVNQISFSVSEGEIFGLLGVNGAGKTTTFKMLMGDESVSHGDAYVGGYSVKSQLGMVHKNIGYCPQFDAVFDELTGRETLNLFSMLRGFDPTIAAGRAIFLAQVLGFTKHLDKRVGHYSGGNKRKLSTALALLGRTRLVSVDEPTTGVDPAAKRQVWRVLRGARAAGRGVLLTSHSMEECEALCSRLAIMVNGKFQCLGSPQHLKNKFSQGFTLTIKMKLDDVASRTSEEIKTATDDIKTYISNQFTNSKIMEEYQGLLTYYLPEQRQPWSKIFGILERGRKSLLIEDYNIAQTTLEQIFLQFTKYQKIA